MASVDIDPDKILTLGDIMEVLQDLQGKGAHLGSIYWVLRNQFYCDCNDCDYCDAQRALDEYYENRRKK